MPNVQFEKHSSLDRNATPPFERRAGAVHIVKDRKSGKILGVSAKCPCGDRTTSPRCLVIKFERVGDTFFDNQLSQGINGLTLANRVTFHDGLEFSLIDGVWYG